MKIHHSPLTRRQLLAVLAALAAPLAPTVARAHSYKLGDIAVGHIWASAPESGEGVAVYGPILNRGDGAAQLTGASTPAARCASRSSLPAVWRRQTLPPRSAPPP